MSTVSIACTLPNGIIIEAAGKRITLAGTLAGARGLPTVHPLHLTPGITSGVDEATFDAWAATHPTLAAAVSKVTP